MAKISFSSDEVKEIKESIERWLNNIKKIFEVATGMEYDKNKRYEANLEFIINESFKIKDEKRLA